MKKILLLIAFNFSFLIINCYSQSLSVFDIDTTAFPLLKAKFYAFDAGGNQVLNISPTDFKVTENGQSCKVLNVTCPTQKQPVPLSITMSLDKSGSMGYTDKGELPVKLGKITACELVNRLVMGQNDMAFQTCDAYAQIVQDFTNEKNNLIAGINKIDAGGDNNFTEQFLNKLTGLFNIAKTGKYRKIAVLYTDAWWYALQPGELQQCIDTCKKYNITFYAIIYTRPEAEPNGIKTSIQSIADATGGKMYDGVISSDAARLIANDLSAEMSNIPCELEWQSWYKCQAIQINADITWNGSTGNLSYIYPYSTLAGLEFNPIGVSFNNRTPGIKVDTTLKVTAIGKDFNVTNITSTNSFFSILPKNFSLKAGQSMDLDLNFTPPDSGWYFNTFKIESDNCNVNYYACGGYKGKKGKAGTLKLTFPNGGEKFLVGSDTVITWEGVMPTDRVNLEYSINNGSSWTTLSNNATGLSHNWNNVPNTPSSQCLAKVSTGGYFIPKIEWQKSLGGSKTDDSRQVVPTVDGGYIVASTVLSSDGDVNTNHGSYDFWVVKLDNSGNIQWQKSLGGSGADLAFSIQQTSEGGYVVAGSTSSNDGDVSGNHGAIDDWIVKLDAGGNIIWQKALGGSGYEYAYSIRQTTDGGFIVAGGSSQSTDGDVTGHHGNLSYGDSWIVKLNKNGGIDWQKSYGGNDDDAVVSVQQTNDGGYVFAGYSDSNDGDVKGNHGDKDYWVVKLDNKGVIQWQKSLGGSGEDVASSIMQTSDEGYIIAGSSSSDDGDVTGNHGDSDYWILKLDKNGGIKWQKSFGGTGFDMAYSAKQTSDGGYIVCGESNSEDGDITGNHGDYGDYWIVSLDNAGNLIWQKSIGGMKNDIAYSIEQAYDGGYIIAGSSASKDGDVSGNHGDSDSWVVKLSAEGSLDDQQDVSDAVWAIVKPMATSKDVDMKQCFIGVMKDSVVTSFITNPGTYPCRIDTIYFTGPDVSQFNISSKSFPAEVPAGGTKNVEFVFQPSTAGIKNANIVIITQSDTLYQKITGIGLEPALKVVSKIIDFGRVYVGNKKDTMQSAVIQNIGTAPVNIISTKHGQPNDKDFSTISGQGPFTLQPGASATMDLRFNPSSNGRTSGTLLFEYNGFGSPAVVQLFGEGFKITPKLTTNSPICEGDDLVIYTDDINSAAFNWSGPNGFSSTGRNVLLKNAKINQSGKYKMFAIIDGMSTDTVSIDIEVNNFLISPGDSSLMFVGSAEKVSDYLKLTNARQWDGGSIWLKKRFSIKKDFATTFKFRTKYGDNGGLSLESVPGADGFAFVFQNQKYPVLGDIGLSMGYSGITNSMAIEFDLYKNDWDPNGNHIAVQSLGAEKNSADHTNKDALLGINDKMITIQQDTIYFAKIEYNMSTKTLIIYVDSTENFTKPALTINNLDLPSLLKLENDEFVYIGFVSSTGIGYQEHHIIDWTIPCKNEYVSVDDKNLNYDEIGELSVYPNPAEKLTTISYNISNESLVGLQIINIYGQEIATPIINRTHAKGIYNCGLETSDYAEGVYFAVLKVGNKTFVKKFVKF